MLVGLIRIRLQLISYYENEVFDMITWDDEIPTPMWDVIDQLEHLDIDRKHLPPLIAFWRMYEIKL